MDFNIKPCKACKKKELMLTKNYKITSGDKDSIRC